MSMWNNTPSRDEVAVLRAKYKPGMRVELIEMRDPQAPKPGTKGTILGVDDAGSVMCRWDNGSRLSLIYNEDRFQVIG